MNWNLILLNRKKPKKSNITAGVICRHPSMDLTDFSCNYLNKLLENISREEKSVFLFTDFNPTQDGLS